MKKHLPLKSLIAVSVALLLGACFGPSQQELLDKVSGMTKPSEIASAIGNADEVRDVGAMQIWKYSASGGDICFSVVGDLALRMSCI